MQFEFWGSNLNQESFDNDFKVIDICGKGPYNIEEDLMKN